MEDSPSCVGAARMKWADCPNLRHGLRASELVALRWDDIDFQTGKLHPLVRDPRARPSR